MGEEKKTWHKNEGGGGGGEGGRKEMIQKDEVNWLHFYGKALGVQSLNALGMRWMVLYKVVTKISCILVKISTFLPWWWKMKQIKQSLSGGEVPAVSLRKIRQGQGKGGRR